MRSQAQVLDELIALTPSGWAFPHDTGSAFAALMTPLAAELTLIETSAEALLPEIDPRTTAQLLPDYERVLGADPYGRDAASLGLTTTQRQLLAWTRWTAGGNSAPADFVALAATLGFAITIQEYWPTIAGIAHVGDFLCCDIPIGVGNSGIGDTIGWRQIVFYWLVQAPIAAQGSPLVAMITGEAPAHTFPVFRFS